MILSHKHRFIYLRTKKTGSTSVGLALASICGPDDIVTPINDPTARQTGHEPRNYEIPPAKRRWLLRLKRIWGADDRAAGAIFWHHMTAAQIRRRIDPATFDAYTKVTIERNPWDREVSNYFWKTNKAAKERAPFETFVRELEASGKAHRVPIDNFDIYSIDGRIVADVVMRHETLAEDFAGLMTRFGVADAPALPAAKSSFRPKGARAYREMYTDETRDIVARVYRREIEAFGYEF